MRWLTRLGGVQDPHGSMPRDMRRTFVRQRPQLKAAVERMLAWEPERIVLAHGSWYEHDGPGALRQALGWLRSEKRRVGEECGCSLRVRLAGDSITTKISNNN